MGLVREKWYGGNQDADPQRPYSGFVGFWGRLGNTSNRMVGKIGSRKKEWMARNKIISGDFLVIAAFPRLLQQDRAPLRDGVDPRPACLHDHFATTRPILLTELLGLHEASSVSTCAGGDFSS
jgi:hypothetical protein